MTDWGPEDPLSEAQIRALGNIALDAWYWVEHPDVDYNGEVGILWFTDGQACFAPEYIADRARAPWFEGDPGDMVQTGMLTSSGDSLLYILLLCWHLNGFTIKPMNGGLDEYEEIIPVEFS